MNEGVIPLLYFGKSLRIGIVLFKVFYTIYTVKPSGSRVFCAEMFLITDTISLLIIGLYRFYGKNKKW